MLNIAASGNFAYLNHLTIIPLLACLDDAYWPRLLRTSPAEPLAAAATRVQCAARVARRGAAVALFGGISWLAWPVVANLLRSRVAR